jgi:hypothetical protein
MAPNYSHILDPFPIKPGESVWFIQSKRVISTARLKRIVITWHAADDKGGIFRETTYELLSSGRTYKRNPDFVFKTFGEAEIALCSTQAHFHN